MYPIIFISIAVLFLANPYAAQKDSFISKEYGSKTSEEIAAVIKNDLASPDISRQDGAVMFLSVLINQGMMSQKENETVLRLAGDREAVGIASDIVAEHLAGWYEEREFGRERGMPVYYPLIHLLALSDSRTAAGTLSFALPALGFDPFFRKSVFSNGRALKTVSSRLSTIENRMCCLYPGREQVCDMEAIDLRLALLSMYLEAARDKSSLFSINGAEMKKLVSGCLEFGNGNRGRIIRARAVEMACILIKAGQKDLLPAVQKIAESDPAYLYKAAPAEGGLLPRYDIKSKYYPVREKAEKELSQLSGPES